MLELIKRLRDLLDADVSYRGETSYTRGMWDVLSALEERADTIRTVTQPIGVSSEGALRALWERA